MYTYIHTYTWIYIYIYTRVWSCASCVRLLISVLRLLSLLGRYRILSQQRTRSLVHAFHSLLFFSYINVHFFACIQCCAASIYTLRTCMYMRTDVYMYAVQERWSRIIRVRCSCRMKKNEYEKKRDIWGGVKKNYFCYIERTFILKVSAYEYAFIDMYI